MTPEQALERLRATAAQMDDNAQRNFMRELTMQTHVDLESHLKEHAEVAAKVDKLHKAIFEGDEDTPGIAPLAKRVSIWLDGVCRLWKWTLGIGVGIAGLIPIIALIMNKMGGG